MKRLTIFTLVLGIFMVIIGTSCQKRTVQKNQELIDEMQKKQTTVKKTFVIQIKSATNRGTVTIQEPNGEVHSEYGGNIDILNDGRNGQPIKIIVTVPEENKSKQEVIIDEQSNGDD